MSDWTVQAVLEHLEIRIKDVQAQLDRRVAELHREHDKFETTTKEGFVKQNEFRGALEDLGRSMATRRELETIEEGLSERMEALAKQSATERGRLQDRIDKSDRWQSRLGGGLLLIGLLFPAVAATLSALLVYFITR